MIRRATFLFSLTLGLLSLHAHAKEVRLEWDPIEGATSYEFEISRNGESVVKRRVEGGRNSWGVKLPPGVYVFRLRAIDWSKQAGEWSEPSPLFSLPPAPEITIPQDQMTLDPTDMARGVGFRWKPVVGASKYKVEIQKGGALYLSENIGVTGWLFKDALPGDYAIRVASLIEITGPLPSGIDKAQWEGEPSDWVPFRVGKPEPVTLPRPSKDPLEEPRTSLAIMPTTSFFQTASMDPSTGLGIASVVSKFNFGLAIDLGVKISEAWALGARHRVLSTKLGDVSGTTVDSSEHTITSTDFFIGYRPAIARKLELHLLISLEDTPVARLDGFGLHYEPVSLVRLGGGFSLPLFKLLSFQLAFHGNLTAVISRQNLGVSYRNGLAFSAIGTAERSLGGSWYLKGFLGFGSTILNASNQTLVVDQMLTGGGLEYRF